MDKIATIGWGLILLLLVITIFVVKWSIKRSQKTFDKIVESKVNERLAQEKETTKTQQPFTQADFEEWKRKQSQEP